MDTKTRTLSLKQRGLNFEMLMWIFTRLSALAMYAIFLVGLVGAFLDGSALPDEFCGCDALGVC